MKNGKRKLSLKAADGVILPGAVPVAARPVSPFSLRGMGNALGGMGSALGGAYQGAVDATSRGMDAVHAANPWVNHVPQMTAPAMAPAPVAAPAPIAAPAPVAAPTDGMPSVGGAVNAIQAHQQLLQNLADGSGLVRGPGGPIDDKVPAKLSHGEAVLPADTTAAVGPENIQRLIADTHTPAHLQKQGVPPGGPHAARRGLRLADGIPGLDVTESPFTESDARLFGQRPAGTVPGTAQVPGMSVTEGGTGVVDPGPGNPNVGSHVGPSRPMAPAAAEPAAVGAAEAATGGGMAYRAGRALATGLRTAPPALIGGEVAANLGKDKVNSDLAPVDSSAMGTARYLANGEFGKAWDSQAKGAVEAGTDVLRGLASTGDMFLPGHPLTDRLNSGLRADGVLSAPGVDSTAGAGRGSINPPAVQPDAQQPTGPGAAPPLDNSVVPGGAQAAKIQRRGNSFTNTGSYVEDERPGGISPQNDAAATALSDRSRADSVASAGLRGGFDGGTPNLPAGYGTTIPGVNAPASQYESELAARNASVHSMEDGRGMNANQRAQAGLEQQRIAQTGSIAGQRDATERRGQDVNAEVARGGQRVSMRGQDLSYDSSMFGHQITGAGNRARLQYEIGKDNRDFGLRSAEFGQKVQEGNRTASEAADKALQSNLESRYRTQDAKGNNVPDAQKIGEYRAAVNSTVPALVKSLEATGNPQAIAKAQELRQRGAAALDPTDHQRLQQLFDMRDRMAAARGLGPNQGTYQHSDNLLDYQQVPGAGGVDRRTFGGNRIVTPAGSVSVNDLRYADAPANTILPDFNKVGERNLTRGLRTE